MIPKFIETSKLYLETLRDFGECNFDECNFDKKYIYSKDSVDNIKDLCDCFNSCQFFMVNHIPVMIYDFIINTNVSNKKLKNILGNFKQMKQYQELIDIVKTKNDDNIRAVQRQVMALAAKTGNIKLLEFSFQNDFAIDKNVLNHCAHDYTCLKLIIVNYIDDMIKFIKNRTTLSLMNWTGNTLVQLALNNNFKGFKLLYEHVIKNKHIQKKFNVNQEAINKYFGISDYAITSAFTTNAIYPIHMRNFNLTRQVGFYRTIYKNNNYDFFKYLINNKFLMFHYEIGDIPTVQMLNYFFSNTNLLDVNKYITSFHPQLRAVENDNIELLKYLNSHDINIDIEISYNYAYSKSSLTWSALRHGSIECLKYMTENGFKSLYCTDKFGRIKVIPTNPEKVLECLKYIYPAKKKVSKDMFNRCSDKSHIDYLLELYENRYDYITIQIVTDLQTFNDFNSKFYDKKQITLLITRLVNHIIGLSSCDRKRIKKKSKTIMEKIKYIHANFANMIDVNNFQNLITNLIKSAIIYALYSQKKINYINNLRLELTDFFIENNYPVDSNTMLMAINKNCYYSFKKVVDRLISLNYDVSFDIYNLVKDSILDKTIQFIDYVLTCRQLTINYTFLALECLNQNINLDYPLFIDKLFCCKYDQNVLLKVLECIDDMTKRFKLLDWICRSISINYDKVIDYILTKNRNYKYLDFFIEKMNSEKCPGKMIKTAIDNQNVDCINYLYDTFTDDINTTELLEYCVNRENIHNNTFLALYHKGLECNDKVIKIISSKKDNNNEANKIYQHLKYDQTKNYSLE